jgi:hypothetical protein
MKGILCGRVRNARCVGIFSGKAAEFLQITEAMIMANNDLELERLKAAPVTESQALTTAERIEIEKLSIERDKAKWTAFSVIVPLLAAIATAFYGFWSSNRQALQSFQLEAAKAIMQVPAGSDMVERITLLKEAFPEQLASFKVPQEYSADYYKLEFLKLLASRGLTPAQIGKVWSELFPGDRWANAPEILKDIDSMSNTSSTVPISKN